MANCGGSKPVVQGCIFEGYPEDYSAYFGGGMFNDGSAPEVGNSVFSGNKAVWGGGMYNVGVGADPLITNCVFAGNKAPLGGAGIMNYSGAAEFNNVPVLVNCTFSRNHHPADIGPEQAMYNRYSAPTVTNCILWGDEDETGGLIEGPAVVTSIRADASFRHCDIEHSRDEQNNWYDANGRDGGGNIDETPMFRDETQPAGTSGNIWMTADDGLRLQNTSPCIDRADGDFAPEKDILGVRRYDETGISGGTGQPPYAEIGAYEYHPLQVHFSGLVISDEVNPDKSWVKAFDNEADCTDIIEDAGEYADTEIALDDAIGPGSTLDSIAIRDGVKLTIWSGKNFTGQILLKKKGPAIIYNVFWNNPELTNAWKMMEAKAKQWSEPLQSEFPQSVRVWSKTNMYDSDNQGTFDYWWEKGSFKIE